MMQMYGSKSLFQLIIFFTSWGIKLCKGSIDLIFCQSMAELFKFLEIKHNNILEACLLYTYFFQKKML